MSRAGRLWVLPCHAFGRVSTSWTELYSRAKSQQASASAGAWPFASPTISSFDKHRAYIRGAASLPLKTVRAAGTLFSVAAHAEAARMSFERLSPLGPSRSPISASWSNATGAGQVYRRRCTCRRARLETTSTTTATKYHSRGSSARSAVAQIAPFSRSSTAPASPSRSSNHARLLSPKPAARPWIPLPGNVGHTQKPRVNDFADIGGAISTIPHEPGLIVRAPPHDARRLRWEQWFP